MKQPSTGDLYVYNATVRSVYDGDTFRADLDMGLGVVFRGEDGNGIQLRLRGCNAIELHDLGGKEAQQNLASLLPIGSTVTLRTVKSDKYGGRYDAQITLADGRDLVSLLIQQGYAVPYTGQGPKLVPIFPPVPLK